MPSFTVTLTEKLNQLLGKTTEKGIEAAETVEEVINDPTGFIEENVENTFNTGIKAFIGFSTLAFVYMSILALILFSIYQIFKNNPNPVSDLSKGASKVYKKSKSIVKKKVNKGGKQWVFNKIVGKLSNLMQSLLQ